MPVQKAESTARPSHHNAALSRRTLLAAGFPALLSAQKRRPNILLLLGDNWAAPHASCLGDQVVRTPNFDRLASEGVLFTHAFAPNPSCSPSRSSLLTGRVTHRLGEAASLYGPLDPSIPRYTQLLEDAGYFIGLIGKGWAPGTIPPEPGGRKRNFAGDSFESLDAFLAAKPEDHPFCLWFGSRDPHVPWDRGQQFRSQLKSSALSIPEHLPDHDSVREDILGYYAEVAQFDYECGQMLETLQKHGELDNTLVIMTGDNGWQMPRGLANCYDSGVRIPLALRLPGHIRKGQIRHDFASIYDLCPTILEAAGVPVPGGLDGRSLFSSFRRNEIFLERERHANVRKGNLSYPIRGIRTADFLYLRNLEPDRWPAGDPEFYWAVGPYGDVDNCRSKEYLLEAKPQPYFDLCFGKRPPEELFDLRKDPGQVRNVASHPAMQTLRKQLAAKVDQWMRDTADPRAKGGTNFWDEAPYTGPKFKGKPLD
jgi:N-sulfoglucosamine sulfohydrolase